VERAKKRAEGLETKTLRRRQAREKTRNKNTNRNKVGFAFDKHRKKAQRKVITYTSASYDGLHRPVSHSLESTSFAIAQAETPSTPVYDRIAKWLKKKITPGMIAVLLSILIFELFKLRKREREREENTALSSP